MPVVVRRAKAISAARVIGTTRRSVGTAFLHPAMTTVRLSARAAAGAEGSGADARRGREEPAAVEEGEKRLDAA